MKKLSVLLLSILMIAGLAACGGDDPQPVTSTPAVMEEPAPETISDEPQESPAEPVRIEPDEPGEDDSGDFESLSEDALGSTEVTDGLTGPETTVPGTASPETTSPETPPLETTDSETISPETPPLETTDPETTSPEATAPDTTAPGVSAAINTDSGIFGHWHMISTGDPLTAWTLRNGWGYSISFYEDGTGIDHWFSPDTGSHQVFNFTWTASDGLIVMTSTNVNHDVISQYLGGEIANLLYNAIGTPLEGAYSVSGERLTLVLDGNTAVYYRS